MRSGRRKWMRKRQKKRRRKAKDRRIEQMKLITLTVTAFDKG